MIRSTDKPKRLGSADPRRIILWVRAGGRCEFPTCNKYLLDDEDTGFTEVFLGEFAHIVACSKKGVRQDELLTREQLESIENQLLLCPTCHAKIDKKKLEGEFDRTRLLTYKREHEQRIQMLGSIAPDRSTTVLRLIGLIRGNSFEVTAPQVRTAVVRELGMFPHFPFNQHEIDIDLRGILEDTPDYWRVCTQIIDRRLMLIRQPGIGGEHIRHLSIFALGRIPLVTYLGFRLGDKTPTALFEKQRGEGNEAWCWPNEEPLDFEYEVARDGSATVVVVVSVSGEVDTEKLPTELEDAGLVVIRPKGVKPGRGLISSKESLARFRSTYAEVLRRLEASGTERIALVPAVSCSVAMVLGREVLRPVTPPVDVYDITDDGYKKTITLE